MLVLAGVTALGQQPIEPAPVFAQLPPTEPVFRSSKAPVTAPAIPPAPAKQQPSTLQNPVSKSVPAHQTATDVMSAQTRHLHLRMVQAEEPMADPAAADELRQYQILLEPPSAEALFGRLDSEKMLEQRMRQQAKQLMPPNTVQFPDRPVLAKTEFQGRSFPPQVVFAEPRFVSHHRLYFEEKNAERYGWDLGFIQPVLSTLYFYRDVIFLPHNIVSHPCRRYDTSAGHCLPGDPVPYIIYPPEFTLVGGIAEGALAVGLFAVIP